VTDTSSKFVVAARELILEIDTDRKNPFGDRFARIRDALGDERPDDSETVERVGADTIDVDGQA